MRLVMPRLLDTFSHYTLFSSRDLRFSLLAITHIVGRMHSI